MVVQLRRCSKGFGFRFHYFVGLKARSIKSGLDHQTKNPLNEKGEKMGMAEWEDEKTYQCDHKNTFREE